jgi:hypothetical protein
LRLAARECAPCGHRQRPAPLDEQLVPQLVDHDLRADNGHPLVMHLPGPPGLARHGHYTAVGRLVEVEARSVDVEPARVLDRVGRVLVDQGHELAVDLVAPFASRLLQLVLRAPADRPRHRVGRRQAGHLGAGSVQALVFVFGRHPLDGRVD